MAFLFVPGMEELNLGSSWRLDDPTVPCVSLNGTLTPRPFSWPEWRTRPWISRLYPTMSQPSTACRGVESWISSLRASRASRGASPASNAAPLTSDGYGIPSGESFARWNPLTCSWKTSMGSSQSGESSPYLGRWPTSGSMRSGYCTAQPLKVLHTNASACSYSLPTPSATSYGSNQSPTPGAAVRPSLAQLARLPTPTAGDAKASGSRCKGPNAKGHPGTSLTDAVVRNQVPTPSTGASSLYAKAGSVPRRGRWATPTARDGKGAGFNNTNLPNQVGPGLLSPRFVEWLMGIPIGWTSCEPLEMASYLSWLRVHSASFGTDSTEADNP